MLKQVDFTQPVASAPVMKNSFFCNSEAAMICALQNCFQHFYVEYAFRFQLTQDIQNALPAAITVIRICDLSGQNFRTGTFFIAKLVYMAGHDHFPKVSVPIHSLAVCTVKFTICIVIVTSPSGESGTGGKCSDEPKRSP